MDGNKKVAVHMLYAAIMALGSLPSVALSSTMASYRIHQNAVASKR